MKPCSTHCAPLSKAQLIPSSDVVKLLVRKIGTDGCAGHGAGGWGRDLAAWGNAGANPALYQEPYTLMNGSAAWLMHRLAGKYRRRHAGRSSEAKSECPSIARSPGREVPMTIGESSERAQSVGQICTQAGASAPSGAKTAAQRSAISPIRRVFSTFLAVTLAVSMTPSAALAETQDAAASSVQAQSQELDGALPQDQNAESPESAAPFASDLTASGSPDAAASDSEQSKTSDQLETAAASAQS